MSWPIDDLDPFCLSVRVRVTRVVLTICFKAALDGRLGRDAARDRERVLGELYAGSRNPRRAAHSLVRGKRAGHRGGT